MSQRDKSILCSIMKVSNPYDERRSNLPLKQTLSRHWFTFQRELFPWLEEVLGPLGERYERLVRVVELVRVEEWLPYSRGLAGPAAEGSCRAGAGLSGEGGAGRAHHPGAGGAAEDGGSAAPAGRRRASYRLGFFLVPYSRAGR